MLDTIPFTSVHSNLEHGLAILTESFSPLRSVLHNLSCWSPKQKCMLSYMIPFYTMYTYYLVTKLNTDATSRTWQLDCYVVKFRFTSLYGKMAAARVISSDNMSRL